MIALEPVQVPLLETPRLWLRPWKNGDFEEYLAIVSDPEVMRYMGCGLRYQVKRTAFRLVTLVSEVGARWKIRQLVHHWHRCGFGEWAVEEKASGKLIGRIGLTHHPDWIVDVAKVEIGWLLARHAWGQGFATEGAKVSLAYAFEQLKLERIISIARSDNFRSQNVMQRIGLAAVGETHWNGCNVVWWAMDRRAWNQGPMQRRIDGKELLHAADSNEERCVIAHVNYLFFHSTQTFIYFFLSRFQRVRPICLTRLPESMAVTQGPPPSLAADFYLYGQQSQKNSVLKRLLWSTGILVRSLLARIPPRMAEPLLDVVHRKIVPRLRPEANAGRFLAWAEDVLRQRQARLIHAYFGPVGWRMLELKRKLGIPLVVTFLGDEIATTLEPWWWWWIQSESESPDWPARLRELLQEGDLFLAEGPFLRDKLIDFGCPPEKVKIQHIAIPVREMPFRVHKPRTDGKVIILFAGRFCEQKGVMYALQAMREIWQTKRNIEFRMIGDEKLTDGKYAAQIYAFIRKHHLQDCVRLLGFLNHADYLRELQQADIFLHPSVTGANGISEGGAPTTILEAQAMGIPVVSTVHCDIPNVTVPGESAILVPERNSKRLALALEHLIDHPEMWHAMGTAGRRFIEAHHDIEREVPALEEIYLDLLNRCGVAADQAS